MSVREWEEIQKMSRFFDLMTEVSCVDPSNCPRNSFGRVLRGRPVREKFLIEQNRRMRGGESLRFFMILFRRFPVAEPPITDDEL